jgi:ribosomal protein S18 acetylase RimI-like enzyme
MVAVRDPVVDVCELRPELHHAVRTLILDGLREHWGTLDPALNRDLDDLSTVYADGVTLVACDRGEVVGTGTVRRRGDDSAEIVRMSIAPSHRRSGLGRRLTEALDRSRRVLHAVRLHVDALRGRRIWQRCVVRDEAGSVT